MYNKIPESAITCGNAINILSHSHIIKYEYINIGLNTNGHDVTAGNGQRARVLQLKGCHSDSFKWGSSTRETIADCSSVGWSEVV